MIKKKKNNPIIPLILEVKREYFVRLRWNHSKRWNKCQLIAYRPCPARIVHNNIDPISSQARLPPKMRQLEISDNIENFRVRAAIIWKIYGPVETRVKT